MQAQSDGQVEQFSVPEQVPSPQPTHCPLPLHVNAPLHVPQVPPQPFDPHCLPEHWGVQHVPLRQLLPEPQPQSAGQLLQSSPD